MELINMKKKLSLFSSLLNEVENAKAEIENEYQLGKSKHPDHDNIFYSFFRICYFITNRGFHAKQIDLLCKKIDDELYKTCNHQFVEDDIECNMGDIHISYCIICEIKK